MRTFDNETDFISVVLDKLSDLRTSDVSAVLPDGTKLDEAALRAKYAKYVPAGDRRPWRLPGRSQGA